MSFCSENDDDDYPLPSPPEFTFTPSDVRLLINTPDDTLAYAHVSSHALVLASPVWKNFLFPPWSTSTEKVLEHDFSDDDPAALLVLLRIAHLKLKGIEEFAPSKDLLVDLAILCNKYVCGDLLYPWIAGWVDRHCGGKVEVICKRLDQSLRKKMYKPTSTYESQLMMLVGWIFREHPDLTECFAAGASWMLFQSAEFPEFRSIGRCRLRSWEICNAWNKSFDLVSGAMLHNDEEKPSISCVSCIWSPMGRCLQLDSNLLWTGSPADNPNPEKSMYRRDFIRCLALRGFKYPKFGCLRQTQKEGPGIPLALKLEEIKDELLKTLCPPSKFKTRPLGEEGALEWKDWNTVYEDGNELPEKEKVPQKSRQEEMGYVP